VLRQVSKEKIEAGIWSKLEDLYMTKSLVNCLKQALYSFKMQDNKIVEEQVYVFNKLILDLENIDVTIEDEDQALLLLPALPKTFTHFKETLLYGRDSLTLVEAQSALNSKELNERNEQRPYVHGEGLLNKGHTRRFCPDRQKENRQDQSKEPGNGALVEDGYESAEALMVSHENTMTKWILDSGCSFHMTLNKS